MREHNTEPSLPGLPAMLCLHLDGNIISNTMKIITKYFLDQNVLSLLAEPFPPTAFVPIASPEVEKFNDSEYLDFKCRLGQLENSTLAMYNVSWFRSTPAVHLKTEVIAGNAPRKVHATLHELRARGFRLGDTVSFQISLKN